MPGIDRYRPRKSSFAIDEINQERPEDIKPVLTVKGITAKARAQKLWVYDPSQKHWYNPEEFETKYERVVRGNEKFLQQVELKCPFEGIIAANQQIESIQSRLKYFTMRVIDYYRTYKNTK